MAKGDAGDAVPRGEMFGGETARIDTSELFGLIEKTEGTATAERALASGTPGIGLPQLDANVITMDAIEPPLPMPPEPRRSRWFDMAIGAALSAIALSTWYLMTQL
jgi:hypothetical protein